MKPIPIERVTFDAVDERIARLQEADGLHYCRCVKPCPNPRHGSRRKPCPTCHQCQAAK